MKPDLTKRGETLIPLITRDPDIRASLLGELAVLFPNTNEDLILQEFGCKKARIDVAVVNGSLHGFEIKSDSDTLERLAAQICYYGEIFDFVTLVCGQKLFRTARKLVPQWWGLKLAVRTPQNIDLRNLRRAKRNPSRNKLALAKMLWKDEALANLKINGFRELTSKNSAAEIWDECARRLSAMTLSDAVRTAIKIRGGSGFARPSAQDGGSYTTGSIALLGHYSENLAWLLSQLPQRHPD